MEPLKHECGVAMIRLRKPLKYYKEKYGSYNYALDRLYLLMEKQHNRGQEAAGVGVVKMHAAPGNEYVFRERALGSDAIAEIFAAIHKEQKDRLKEMSAQEVDALAPFVGQIYMGHLRYSTTGRSGISYVHPFLRRNNWRSRNLLLCGNFNMTNTSEIFQSIVDNGQHPRIYSDTIALLEQLGYELDRENHRIYREFRDKFTGEELALAIEDNLKVENILDKASGWDGGFVICGATGSGDMFALRDAHGIRPAFYYADDEVVVLASERPVIQTVFNVPLAKVSELAPGEALIVDKAGEMKLSRILPEGDNRRCSFERIYFSRGSDADIYRERKRLGEKLVPEVLKAVADPGLKHTIFSFIPNTAEVAFLGMATELNRRLEEEKKEQILALSSRGELTPQALDEITAANIRIEKIVLKDIKLRTFISESDTRNDLAAHVYDLTYGCTEDFTDNLVVIDDSIVRGTTLRRSIVSMLRRLKPKKIVVVSSSPQVRYPDCYGIDMSSMKEFIAFRAAIELIRERGMWEIIEDTYRGCLEELKKPAAEQVNRVKAIYAPFTDREISEKIAEMITPAVTKPGEWMPAIEVVYQTLEGLHEAIPDHPGDWYFSGDYPTPGGVKFVNQAFVNYYEGKTGHAL